MKTIELRPDDLVEQQPATSVVYGLPRARWGDLSSGAPIVRSLAPAALQTRPTVDVLPPQDDTVRLAVSGGVAGARYQVQCGAQSFQVRVTHHAARKRGRG